MGSPTYTPSTLSTKAIAAAADVEKDLEIPDPSPEKAKAVLENLEEEESIT